MKIRNYNYLKKNVFINFITFNFKPSISGKLKSDPIYFNRDINIKKISL